MREASPRAKAIVRERPPADTKDWNDALRAQERPQERAEGRTHERERNPERGHGGGRAASGTTRQAIAGRPCDAPRARRARGRGRRTTGRRAVTEVARLAATSPAEMRAVWAL